MKDSKLVSHNIFAGPLRIFQDLRRINLPEPVVMTLMILLTTALGVGLGFVMMTPAGLILPSIVGIAFYLIVIASNPLSGVALWLVLYPFAERTINISLGKGIPDLSPTRFVIAFLIAVLLGQAATGQRRFPRITKLDIVCLLSIIGIGISAGASYDPIRAFKAVLDMNIIPVLAYYVLKNFVRGKKDLDLLFNAFLIIATYTCFFIFNEWVTGNILFYRGHSMTVYGRTGIRVVRSLWGTPDGYASIFAMAIPLAFYRMIKAKGGHWRTIYGFLLAIFLLGQVLAFKRAGWVASLVSFIIMFPFFPSFRKVFLVMLILIGIPMGVFWETLSSIEGVEQRVISGVDTLHGRTYRWEAAIELWKQKPIVGHGWKNYDVLSEYHAIESHYLHLLVSGGLLAFLPFVCIIILTISESIWVFIRGPSIPNIFVDRDLIAVFWGMFSTYLVKAITVVQGLAIINILFFIIIGAMVGSQGEQLVLYDEAQRIKSGPSLIKVGDSIT